MNSVALVLLITFVPVLCKENLQELEKYLKDPEFIAIVKRLGLDESDIPSSLSDSSANPAAAGVQSHDSGDGSCSKKYNANTIIQTKISLNKGATFLSSEHNVSDAEHCAQKCCETDGCDVSVYQDKEKRACYLFDCKNDINVNKCEFSTHSGYYAIFVTKSSVGAPSRKSAPEETDLSDLKSSRTQNPVSSTVKPTTVSYHPHSVGNGGACVEDLNCEDIHAECTARTCQCRAGYLEKHGQCRKQCGEKEFRCMEPGTAVAGPDCIPRSQFCDGQAQCGDGSDEINCPTTGHSGSAGASHKDGQESSGGTRHAKLDSAGLGAGSVETPGKGKLPDPASSSQTAKPQGAAQTDTDQDGKDAVAVVTGNSDASKPDAPQGTSGTDDDDKGTSSADSHTDSKDDNKDNSKDNSKNGDTKDKETSPAPAVTKKPEKGANATGNTAAPAVAGPGLGVSQEESADFVEKMSLIEAYTTKGPIIALSLGLCFTVILLVFVGCRLRNVRRRLLKGRPLHSNEADYLINGMYL